MTRTTLSAAIVCLAMGTASQAQSLAPLTLAEATARALAHVPEIAIQREAIDASREAESRAAAAFDPVMRLEGRLRSRTDPLNTLFVGAPDDALAPRVVSVQSSAAWTRLFQSGATVTATASLSREDTNGRFALLTPAWFTGVGVDVRQPLRAGRRIDAARRAIVVSALDASRSRTALERVVSDIVARVEQAYWMARTAREDVQIREDALALAEAYRRETADRIELGIAAEADLAAPEAEIARRRADLVRARDEATRASLALQHLVAGSADGPEWDTGVDPTDPPPALTSPVDDTRTLVATALERRPELRDLDIARQVAEADTALAEDRIKAQVDLVASYALRGLAGRENPNLFVPFPGGVVTLPDVQRGSLDDSLQTLATHRFSDVFVGLSVSLPVGRRAARADAAAAGIAERRVAHTRDALARRIAADVRVATARLVAARERVEAAAALAQAADAVLDAEQARDETGQSTAFLVLTRQTEQAQAALALTAARLDVARAQTDLLHVTGQLLDRRGISLASPEGTAR